MKSENDERHRGTLAARGTRDRPDLFGAGVDAGGRDASELMRSEPAPGVASWVRDRDRRELRTAAITLAEVRYGIARLPDGRRKQILLAAGPAGQLRRTVFSD